MKFATTQLREGLEQVKGIVPTRTTLPILGGILFTCEPENEENGDILLTATDLTMMVGTTIHGEIDEGGKVVIPADKLYETVKAMGNREIEVSLNPKNMTVTLQADGMKANIKCFDPADYPEPPQVKPVVTFTTDSQAFAALLERVAFSAAVKDDRPALKSVCFRLKGKTLELAGADGFRLASLQAFGEIKGKDADYLVPLDAVKEIIALAKSRKEQATVNLSEAVIQVLWDGAELAATLLSDAKFPDFTQVIPNPFPENQVTVDRTDLVRAVNMANVFSQDGHNIVKFTVADKSLTVSGMGDDGAGESEMPAQTSGEHLVFALNGSFVKDYLGLVKDETVTFALNTPSSPVCLRDGDENWQHIVMPLHIGN